MTDTSTQKPLHVLADDDANAYILVAVQQLKDVKSLLDANGIRYWVDEFAISINGKPEMTVINLGRGVDAQAVQEILDDAT